jgi:hypothetical protein
MKYLPHFRFGSGRSSWRRGLAALFVAPVLATIPVGAALALSDIQGGSLYVPPLVAGRAFVVLAIALLKLTILLGGPSWPFLRLIRQESGWIYGLVGLAEALAAVVGLSYSFNGYFRDDQIMEFLFVGLVGAIMGSLFWWIARDPREAQR